MNNRLKKVIVGVASLLFWVVIWEILSRVVNFSFIRPGVFDTALAFASLLPKTAFWLTVSESLLRILAGLVLGLIFGVLLGCLSAIRSTAHSFLSPIMTVVRCTPVASFIMIVWFLLKKDYIPTVIALFMVLPIIWQSTAEAIQKTDKDLLEVAQLYKFSPWKKLRYAYSPTIIKYLIPSAVTSLGLAWKAGVAAEIITSPENSIGAEISNAKNAFEGAEMFAWTLTVVLLSLALEFAVKSLLRRVKRI